MKKNKCKPEMYNSYETDSSVVSVNEFSTIPLEEVTDMVTSSFPLRYNCIRVTITCKSPLVLDNVVKDFVDYSKKVFSVVLVQSSLLHCCVFSIFCRYSLSYIVSKLHGFLRPYSGNSLVDIEF